MAARVRPRTVLAWSALWAMAACNGLWGIDDGTLLPPGSGQAGQGGEEPSRPPAGAAGAGAGHGRDAGQSPGGAGGAGGAAAGAGGAADGGESPSGGVNGGGTSSAGTAATAGSAGSAGSMSGGGGGGGTSPSCSGCKLNEKKTESRACGRCGTGSQTRSATCDANCTWGAWSAWTTCSQCDAQNYRCCGTGKWEWCYQSDCAWTNDCEACADSSCPEC